MKKILRKLSVLAGLLVLVAGIILSMRLGNSESATTPDIDAVDQKEVFARTLTARNQTIDSEVGITGRLIAKQKIDLFAEVVGTLKSTGKEFREGVYFRKGETMLTIDNTEAKLDLQAAKSQLYSTIVTLLPDLESDHADNFEAWKSYVDNFDSQKPIERLPETKSQREKLYIAARNLENQYLSIKRREYQLTKYRIQAPFSGVLTAASTYPGGLVRNGQKLGELINPNSYELEATVPLHDAQYFRKGAKVALHSEAIRGSWTGTVSRFGKTIDNSTQTQKVFINVSGKDLNEGMFLQARVSAQKVDDVLPVARKLLIDGNGIYIVENGKLKLQQVEIIRYAGNDALVRGILDSTLILAEPVLGAYDGMEVKTIKS